jgi:serine/threonine protein kinase
MPQAPTAVLGRTAQAEFPRAFGILSLLKPLARHAKSEIYVALRPEGVDRLCVVHMLPPELVDRPGVTEGLRGQASWLVARVHGNLVQTYDVGQGGGRLFLLNEYVEGRDLAAVLEDLPKRSIAMPVTAAVFVALEVSAALGFIRSTEERVTGVPTSLIGFSAAGVIASREGTIKVVHHGSALAPLAHSLTDKERGRVSLIAPEHAEGGGSPRGDVYAVGALLWQMLTGKPLGNDGADEHLDQLRAGTFTAPRASAVVGPDRGIPSALDDLVASALARKPEDRPVSCEALRAHLVSVVKGVGGAGSNALRALMGDLYTTVLAAESAELAALSKIAEKELPRLAARPRAATLTNFDPMSKRGATPGPVSRDSELPLNEVIPGTRYRVREKLGEGGMGAVYLAEHVDIERRVALKLVHAELLRNPMVLGQFRQEARAASRIGNPYICDVTDWGELPDGRVFFVMEYLDGRSLGRVLEDVRKVTPARCIPILRQVAKALGSAHEKGIVHLDVKPDNVLLVSKDGRADAVKVVDFGVAGILGQQSGSRVMGTPEYMAPERATGKTYDHRSDVYSLGVMAYEMLVGEVPFQGPTPIETLSLQASEVPDRINERLRHPIPEALETVVMGMIEKQPGRRPQNMAEVEALLLEAQIEAGIRTPWDDLPLPAVATERAARISRKLTASARRTFVIGAATVVAAVGVISIVYAVSQPPKVMTVTRLSAPTPRTEIAPMPVPEVSPAAPGGQGGRPAATPQGPTPASNAGTPRPAARVRREDPSEDAAEPRDPAASRRAAQLGQEALEAGRFEEAKAEFERAVAADSRNVTAIGGLAEVAFERARYEEAAYYANRAVRLNRSTKYLMLLADSSFRIGRFSDALVAYQRAKNMDPSIEGIDTRIKNVQAKLGRIPK